MEYEVNHYYDILLAVCQTEEISLKIRYKQMRDLFERICREQMQDESLQMTDLSARISFMATKFGLTYAEQNRLHTFRLTSNRILNREEAPQQAHLLRDAKTLTFFIRKLYGITIPNALYTLLPQVDATYHTRPLGIQTTQRIRVCFQHADEEYLYVTPADSVTDEPLRVRYNVPQVNDEFADTCNLLWRYAQLNLLDVEEDAQGILTPSFIVLEPDYLLDISSLAECYKDYGHHPLNYQLGKLQTVENTAPVLLGNIVNLFLDEWIYADSAPDYSECMQKAFRRYPIELAACADLRDPKVEREFFKSCRLHFDHIQKTVQETFYTSGYNLERADAVLEPSYICEALGLQGRLDYMQRDMRAFIEMKSGKADEFSVRNSVVPKENNRVQMLLYQAVLEYAMGMNHRNVTPYLLYTRYPLLYPARSSWAMVRRVINLRNKIVADEYSIQLRNSVDYTTRKIGGIRADVLNEKGLKGKFWVQYLCPNIDSIAGAIASLTDLERAYFYALYNFIVKEQYTSKSGDVAYEGRAGAASLWLSTLEEKREAGEILYDLSIAEHHASDEHKAYIVLEREKETVVDMDESVSLPNFRQGDAIVLYERNVPTDNVTNKMVFKGNIETITDQSVKVRLRATQHNTSVLPIASLYAIEHDTMDTSFRAMYMGLAAFLNANKSRRDLLLGQRLPEFDQSLTEEVEAAENSFTRIALKAKAAKDYFLLVGPPGTGKTSCALRSMVELFHTEPDTQILLLAYTNRAVDEICKSLISITPQLDFIRIGSELSCDVQYRPFLIENVLADCVRRTEVNERITRCRVFVGTVATLSGKSELFRLKHFDVAIIDEATQILEPQLLSIFCGKSENGKNAVDKFVLIGDHKQLPAVVLQPTEQTEVYNESLQAIGLTNIKDSLFERLYRTLQTVGADSEVAEQAMDMLCKQGRMHPEVAHFANVHFYDGKLEIVGLAHQTEQLSLLGSEGNYSEFTDILNKRMAFISSEPERMASSCKINRSEAHIIANLAAEVYIRYSAEFDVHKTLGIIAPYRSQIALIKKEIALLNIKGLEDVLVDTVERFQGSERDVILYSFCVNRSYQLRMLANIIEENGVQIDRKLNVVMTRARKQIFITGVRDLLMQNAIYANLIGVIDA